VRTRACNSAVFLAVFAAFALHLRAADGPEPNSKPAASRTLRTTGMVEAVRTLSIQVPRISGQQGGNLTLTKLVANGAKVQPGDIIAEFDRTTQLKAARDAAAKFDDLTHQVEQKAAEHKSNAAKRSSDYAQAEADLGKARLEIRKGPVLSEIEHAKADEILKNAEFHTASLRVSMNAHERAEADELQVLRLQAERQKVTLARVQADAEKLVLRATIPGMIALQNIWRNNSMGHAREGDQLWPGNPLLRIFDPSRMVLQLAVSETDGAVLHAGARATVHLDAYPALTFTAHFDSASPVAASPVGSPIKAFTARFILEQDDPHLLPDLAAAADIDLVK
jgi:HlyD family secretion protein